MGGAAGGQQTPMPMPACPPWHLPPPCHPPPCSFFLPPIIFYAGLSVKKKHFFRNFFTITGYGILGTYFCFAFISTGLYLCLRSYLTFGVSLTLCRRKSLPPGQH
jgi:NhaP-type Na+/H+ or K+/H+ antiporter